MISISDSDDEKQDNKGGTGVKVEDSKDEAMTRRLTQEWAVKNGTNDDSVKGKGRAARENAEEKADIIAIDVSPNNQREGINGSSSSSFRSPPSRTSPSPEKKPKVLKNTSKPETRVAEIFAKSQPVTPPGSPIRSLQEDIKPIVSPTKNGTITSTTAEPVEAIDFDKDAFLFRPNEIDTSKWPKGRLPYSVLVGVYVQVSSTRSRLLIVRVLTK